MNPHYPPISARVTQPTVDDIRRHRKCAGLTQAQAAALISAAEMRPERTWQAYETVQTSPEHRAIPLATWELFLLLTGGHPTLSLQAGDGNISTGQSKPQRQRKSFTIKPGDYFLQPFAGEPHELLVKAERPLSGLGNSQWEVSNLDGRRYTCHLPSCHKITRKRGKEIVASRQAQGVIHG